MSHPDQINQLGVRPIVLAVDDVPENLSIISTMLSTLGVDVRVAANGPSAVRYASLEPRPDLILLDIMMPGMDGHEVLKQLRAQPETCDIPVIFVTALDSTHDEEIGLREGAVDYITKPIKPTVLRARVLAQLELKKARDLLSSQKAWLEQEVSRRVVENKQLESRLQIALNTTGFGIFEHDYVKNRNEWSESFAQILGHSSALPTTTEALAIIHPEDRHLADEALLSPNDEFHFEEMRVQHRDGHWVWGELRGRILERDKDGKPTRVLGTMADISRRKLAEDELRLSSIVFSGISDGVCITDPQGNILLTNQAFSKVTGYEAAEAFGNNPRMLRSGVHGAEFYRDLWETISRHGNWQGEITNRRKDGELVREWLSISAVKDSSGRLTNYVGIFSDLSEREAAAEHIQYLSSYDPLTNLPNRNLFTDRLNQALINAHRFDRETAVILLDLDRFRIINDTLGPPVGDEILVEVSRRLNLQVREGDTIGRRSGNEFGFVMANLSHERDVIALAQRMLDAITVPFTIAGQSIVITASIGISVSPRNGSETDALLKSADAALLRAKQAGRNNFRCY